MDRLTTRIDRGSEDFESRSATNLALVEALRARLDAAKEGGAANMSRGTESAARAYRGRG